MRAAVFVSGVTSVFWRLVQNPLWGFSGLWVWQHPWLCGPEWQRGQGLHSPGCEAGWRAGTDVGAGRLHWTRVVCGPHPQSVAGNRIIQFNLV